MKAAPAHVSLAAALRRSGLTLATAESLTGGLVAAALTAVPGSSAYFEGGVVAYSNRLKTEMLGVPPAVLLDHGAVSRECALAMAAGARQGLGADIGLATTGIAGPGGAAPGKPVGLVWLAVDGPFGREARRFVFEGDRARVAGAAAEGALALLAERLAEAVS